MAARSRSQAQKAISRRKRSRFGAEARQRQIYSVFVAKAICSRQAAVSWQREAEAKPRRPFHVANALDLALRRGSGKSTAFSSQKLFAAAKQLFHGSEKQKPSPEGHFTSQTL